MEQTHYTYNAVTILQYLDGLEQVVAGHLGHAVVGEHHVDGLLLRRRHGLISFSQNVLPTGTLNNCWRHRNKGKGGAKRQVGKQKAGRNRIPLESVLQSAAQTPTLYCPYRAELLQGNEQSSQC
jgi:hypothetical protein